MMPLAFTGHFVCHHSMEKDIVDCRVATIELKKRACLKRRIMDGQTCIIGQWAELKLHTALIQCI